MTTNTQSSSFSQNNLLKQHLINQMFDSRRVIFVTGAGVSCQYGLPDFRSLDTGLYSKLSAEKMNGKELFDYNLFRSEQKTKMFFKFISDFKNEQCRIVAAGGSGGSTVGGTTTTANENTTTYHNKHQDSFHHLLKLFKSKSKLQRCYTQNIDCFEKSLHGLECLPYGPPPSTTTTTNSTLTTISKKQQPQPDVILLHGNLDFLVCYSCNKRIPFSKSHAEKMSLEMQSVDCPSCLEVCEERKRLGKRQWAVGRMLPDLILYNHPPNPSGEIVGHWASRDIQQNPDMLIVVGTSLRVSGIKKLVKQFAKAVLHTHGRSHSLNSGNRSQQHHPLIIHQSTNSTEYKSSGFTTAKDDNMKENHDNITIKCNSSSSSLKQKKQQPSTTTNTSTISKSSLKPPTSGKHKTNRRLGSLSENLLPHPTHVVLINKTSDVIHRKEFRHLFDVCWLGDAEQIAKEIREGLGVRERQMKQMFTRNKQHTNTNTNTDTDTKKDDTPVSSKNRNPVSSESNQKNNKIHFAHRKPRLSTAKNTTTATNRRRGHRGHADAEEAVVKV